MKEKRPLEEKSLSNDNKPLTAKKTARKKPRKKRKRKTRLFEETRVGHYLKHEAPLEYSLIVGVNSRAIAPSADLIEAIGYASINPLFKKPKFRKALIDYRRNGLHTGQPKKSNAKLEMFYTKIYQRGMNRVLENMPKLETQVE